MALRARAAGACAVALSLEALGTGLLAASCGGAQFTTAPADGGSATGAGSTIEGGSDAGADGSFCASMDAGAHTLCEDFSEPGSSFPGQFKLVGTNNGTVTADTATTRTPPESARATVTASSLGSYVGSALIEHDFTSITDTHFVLSDWVRFDGTTDCLSSPTAGVAIAAFVFPYSSGKYSIEIVVAAAEGYAEIVESVSPDGGSTVLATHKVDLGTFVPDQFVEWTVDVSLGAVKAATLTLGETQGSTETLMGPPTVSVGDLASPTLLLGASVSGPTSGCTVDIDDILFDIRAE